MKERAQKEITIFDFLPKVLPVLDVLFIVWVTINSPRPWLTGFIQLLIPALGFTAILLFKEKGRLGFYLIGIFSSAPLFFLNLWATETCPTWLNEFTFIAGGLMLTIALFDRLVVLSFALFTTIVPMFLGNNSFYNITTIVVAEIAVWFLMERCVAFMNLQRQKVEEQKRVIEEKNKDIIDSINYAKRIQTSLLPTNKYIERILNER